MFIGESSAIFGIKALTGVILLVLFIIFNKKENKLLFLKNIFKKKFHLQ